MILKYSLIIILCAYVLGGNGTRRTDEDLKTLIQTHVIFTPGERTPRPVFIYPTDPYKNHTYYPFGPGELSLRGRKDAYKLGKQLYDRYKNFLGSIYSPEIFESFATYYPWTQTSTQGVHAALFPPNQKYQIDDFLKWQAIPYTYHRWEEDSLICAYRACPLLLSHTGELESTPKYREALREFESLAAYATEHTGIPINTTNTFQLLYSRLQAQELFGLKLPEWTKSIYPDPLYKAANLMWRIMAESPDIQRIGSGAFLKKLTDDFESKITTDNNKKMYLYSTVGFTFVPLIGALGNYNGEQYKFYSYLLFELHKINGIYGVKTYLWDHSSDNVRLIRVLDCAEFCPLSQFKDLVKDKFPRENWCSI